MSARPRDGAERLLRFTTKGLPDSRTDWGAAMRAELAAIDDAAARTRFARSASSAAFAQGFGARILFAAGAAMAVAVIALAASRGQLSAGGPGVLIATVPLPAIPLLAIALLAARQARSFRFGVETGLLGLVLSFGALFSVLAVEGQTWMQRHGVFMLDGDPPKYAIGPADVTFDLLSTGMWVGHVVFWLPWPILGAAIGARLGMRRTPATTGSVPI